MLIRQGRLDEAAELLEGVLQEAQVSADPERASARPARGSAWSRWRAATPAGLGSCCTRASTRQPTRPG